MKKLVSLLIVVVAIFSAFSIETPSAKAITVSPPIMEIAAKRGDVITDKIKVTNESDVEQTYYVSVERFVAEGDQGAASFIEDNNPLELPSWISFPTRQVTVGPDERKVIPFSVSVPQNADPGGHYASIFLSTTPPSTDGRGSQVSIGGRVGVLMLLKVDGQVNETASVSGFAAADSMVAALPVDFSIKVQNAGNVHLKPKGNITVTNTLGKVVAVVDVNSQGSNVLPMSTRELGASWVKNPNAVAGAKSSFWAKYRQEKANFAFGKYSADLSLVYGSASKTLSASTAFWVLPWRVLLVNTVLLVIALAILAVLVRKYNAWIISKASMASGSGSRKK